MKLMVSVGLALAVTAAACSPSTQISQPRTATTSASVRASPAYRTTKVDGLSIFYREAGPKDAPAILLLHGFPSSSHMFRDLIPELAQDFHVIAPDYPGFGNSDTPPAERFGYTFDHLADVMERFVTTVGLQHFALYVQDYGGPVGFRLATRHPEWVRALIVQNANAYEEGVSPAAQTFLTSLPVTRNAEGDAQARKLLGRESTIVQYKTGARNPDGMNPDAWNMDQYGLDRPGNFDIQYALLANYRTNFARYPEWHAYFQKHQPPTLVAWGKGDPYFIVEGAKAYAKDLRNIETHILDTGHFALEEEHAAIAAHIRRFLNERAK